MPLGEYPKEWIADRPLAATTRARYEIALRLQIAPKLGRIDLGDLTPERVRRWRRELLAEGTGAPTTAKAYRLLRAIVNTAVDDERVRRNPCRLKGADKDGSPERPAATIEQVYAATGEIRPWARALVLLAAFTGLRWGELVRLRRHDVDLAGGFVRVAASTPEVGGVLPDDDATKSEAGKRLVGVPAAIVPDLRKHLDKWSEPGAHGRVFVGPRGGRPLRSNYNRYWHEAVGPGSLAWGSTSTICATRRTGSWPGRRTSGS